MANERGLFDCQTNGEALKPVHLHALPTHNMDTKLAKNLK